MAKSLKNLIRVHRWHVDERRRELGQLMTQEDHLIMLQTQMEAEYEAEQQSVRENPEMAGLTLGAYVARYLARRAELEAARKQIALEIEAARERLADAYKELKTYELAEKERIRKEQAERDRKEQAALDEIGLDRYRRRKSVEL